MKDKDVRFKIKLHNSETQLRTNFLRWHLVIIVLKEYAVFKENYFYLKLFLIFSSKFDSVTMDPDPNSTYFDPQHWFELVFLISSILSDIMHKTYSYVLSCSQINV